MDRAAVLLEEPARHQVEIEFVLWKQAVQRLKQLFDRRLLRYMKVAFDDH